MKSLGIDPAASHGNGIPLIGLTATPERTETQTLS